MKYDNQLRSAVRIIEQFRGEMPLHAWLKNYFRLHKQMGSRDRRELTDLAYNYYRLGHAVKNIPIAERILLGIFFCHREKHEMLAYFKPGWNEGIGLPLEEKIRMCRESSIDMNPDEIFPWKDELAAGIDHRALCRSMLEQPDLFLRIRPGYQDLVFSKLDKEGITYEWIPPSALRLANGTRADRILELNRECVVQDYHSQLVGEYFRLPENIRPSTATAWDSCAASGGKSILLHDRYPGIRLWATDNRASILHNLEKRFAEAGITNYRSSIVDLSVPGRPDPAEGSFDIIIADAPCSGSGVWARNPDELYFFDPARIGAYQALQQKILSRIIPSLKKGGRLVYSTCSVFRKEDDEVMEFIRQKLPAQAPETRMLAGYEMKADSMYVASFIA